MNKFKIFTLLICISLASFAGKIERAYKALEIYNYFEAKRLFEKVISKKNIASPFGLSLIYRNNKNPFYNLDSAFKYISIADTNYFKIENKKREKLRDLKIDSLFIENIKDSIDKQVFLLAISKNSVPIFQDYINKHIDSEYLEDAIELRDKLAFEETKEINTAMAYGTFFITYPNAAQSLEAKNRFEERQFFEKTKSQKVQDFQSFIKEFPGSPFIGVAQDSIYFKSTRLKTIKSYYSFVNENPLNRNIELAWRNIYKLYTLEYSPERIVEFRIDYPDYPFKEEIAVDMKLASKDFLPFKIANRWGFMDRDGKIMVPLDFESVEYFREGLSLAVKGGKVGFIDKSGKAIVPFVYDDAESFDQSVAIVAKGDLYGIIDRTNRIVVPLEYELIGKFNDGLALVANKDYYGFVNKTGEIAIPLTLEYATDFDNGYAIIEINNKRGLINTLGKLVVPTEYSWIELFNEYGLSRAKNDSAYGLLDKNGSEVLPFKYDRIGEFSDNLAIIVLNGKYGYIDKFGKIVIPIQFEFKQEALVWGMFSKGHTKFMQKGKYGIIDSTGGKVFPAIFENVGKYDPNNLIAVKKKGKWGYSNQNLKLVIPYKYDFSETFKWSHGIVKIDTSCVLINELDKSALENSYDKIESLGSIGYVITKAGKVGIYARDLIQLLPVEFDKIVISEFEGLLQVHLLDKIFYYDLKDKVMIPALKNKSRGHE